MNHRGAEFTESGHATNACGDETSEHPECLSLCSPWRCGSLPPPVTFLEKPIL